jgi:hypothetical protein
MSKHQRQQSFPNPPLSYTTFDHQRNSDSQERPNATNAVQQERYKQGYQMETERTAALVGKDLDVFATGAVSLNGMYKHQPKSLNIVPSQS